MAAFVKGGLGKALESLAQYPIGVNVIRYERCASIGACEGSMQSATSAYIMERAKKAHGSQASFGYILRI